MRQAIADLLMGGAVTLMLVAMWHLLHAMASTFQAMRAGHGGAWLLWDAQRFHDADRAPTAAQPHVRAVMARFKQLWPWALAAMALAIPAAILAPA